MEDQEQNRTLSLEDLAAAHVYVNHLDKKHWPVEVVQAVELLTNDGFKAVFSAQQVDTWKQSLGGKPAIIPPHAQSGHDEEPPEESGQTLDRVHGVWVSARHQRGQNVAQWIEVGTLTLYDFYQDLRMGILQNHVWYPHETSHMRSLAKLPAPKPNIAIGFYVSYECAPDYVVQYSLVRPAVMDAVKFEGSLNPFAAPSEKLTLVYPCFVWQASDHSLSDAVNQAANAVANMLAKLQALFKRAAKTKMSMDCPLSVFALCVHQFSWEMFVAFQYRGSIHMVTIWKDDTNDHWPLFQVHFIIKRIYNDILKNHMPLVQQKLIEVSESIEG